MTTIAMAGPQGVSGLLAHRPSDDKPVERRPDEPARAALDALAALSRHAAEGVVLLRWDGTIDWVDDAFLAMTGLRRERLLGRRIDVVLEEAEEQAAVLETIRGAVAERRVVAATVPVLRADGRVLMVDVRVEPVDVVAGAAVRWVATLIDATERRQLEHAVATVADEERAALALEIENGPVRELAAARIAVAAAARSVAPGSSAYRALQQALAAIDRGQAALGAVTRGILPLRRGVPLAHALEDYARSLTIPGVVEVTVRNELAPGPIGNEAEQLYRICQEAVVNAVHHAHAHRVEIQLLARDRGVELRVVDDGTGFDAANACAAQGLRMMRLRASSLGARLNVSSGSGEGTVVSCALGA